MSSSFTVANAAAAAKVYSPGIVDASGGQTYVNADSTGVVPQTAMVKHTFGLAKGKLDKHLIGFNLSRAEATGGRGSCGVNITFTIPPIGTTAADLADQIAFAKNFLADPTLVSKLQNGTI